MPSSENKTKRLRKSRRQGVPLAHRDGARALKPANTYIPGEAPLERGSRIVARSR